MRGTPIRVFTQGEVQVLSGTEDFEVLWICFTYVSETFGEENAQDGCGEG